MKGFKDSKGRFRPTERKTKSSLKKSSLRKKETIGIKEINSVLRTKKTTDRSDSYWLDEGKYNEEVKLLRKFLPREGESKSPDIELFRIASNVYYDIYNNGGANLMKDWSRYDERKKLIDILDTESVEQLDDYMELYERGQESLNYNDEDEFEEYGDGGEYVSQHEVDKDYERITARGGVMDRIIDSVIEKIMSMPNNHLEKGGFVKA